jgi:hypothetical protein
MAGDELDTMGADELRAFIRKEESARGATMAAIAARFAQLEVSLAGYRELYSMFGADGATDAKFAEAYERVRLADR